MTPVDRLPWLKPGSLARYDQILLLGGLITLVLLCWWYLFAMAGNMSMDMASNHGVSDSSHHEPAWKFSGSVMLFMMWVIMMTGMMVPTAVRAILIIVGVNAQAPAAAVPYNPATGLFWGTSLSGLCLRSLKRIVKVTPLVEPWCQSVLHAEQAIEVADVFKCARLGYLFNGCIFTAQQKRSIFDSNLIVIFACVRLSMLLQVRHICS